MAGHPSPNTQADRAPGAEANPGHPGTAAELRRWLAAHPRFEPLAAAARASSPDDAAHAFDHLLRVALWTLRLGGADVHAEEAVAAALLHDLVNVPKNHPDRARASELSAQAAEPLLRAAGFDEPARTRIRDAIRDHSFSRGATPATTLGKALQDADRLEAVGAIGLFRVASTGARMGASYFHPEDPWATSRELDDRKHSVDHFFTKLLKLQETFHTPAGREEALRRSQVLERFLDDLALELGEPRP